MSPSKRPHAPGLASTRTLLALALALGGLCATAAPARAEPGLTWQDGPDDAGLSIAVSMDGGAWISRGWAAGAAGPGVELTLYWHGEFDEDSIAIEDTPATAALAPLTLPLLALIPKGALLGNETGMRLRAGATFLPGRGGEESALRASLGFVGRAAPEGRMRTTSFAGAWLPEMGVVWVPGRRSAVTMGWSPFAFAFRVGARTAFEWRAAAVQLLFPMDRGPFIASVGSSLSVELDLDARH